MNRGTGFSFDTIEQKRDFEAYAKSKGMTLSAFAKWAVFAMRSKNRAGGHRKPIRAGSTSAPREPKAST